MTIVSSTRARILRAVAVCALAFGLVACEEDVTDGLSTERPFTIYGYVDPTADTQFVRVFPINPTNLSYAEPGPLDAQVVFRDLTSGEETTGQDSLVQFFSGRYGHVFWAPFRPDYAGQYALEVRRSDGAMSTASTSVPGELDFERGVAYTRFILEAEGFVPFLPMDFAGQGMRLMQVNARYEVELLNVGRQVFDLPYLAEAVPTSGGWHVELDLKRDYERIYEGLRELRQRYGEEQIQFVTLDIVPEVANPEWTPPNGKFDPDLLVEPGIFDNVENGFGFFGSAYQQVNRYPVEPCLRLIVGFVESPLACSAQERCEYLEQCD